MVVERELVGADSSSTNSFKTAVISRGDRLARSIAANSKIAPLRRFSMRTERGEPLLDAFGDWFDQFFLKNTAIP